MPINTRLLKTFLDKTIIKNSERGINLNEFSRFYNEYNSRLSSTERAQAVSFYPLVELYCIFKDPDARIEISGSQRLIRGFGYKTDDISRLISIFVNGTGATGSNLDTINSLFAPLLDLSQPKDEGSTQNPAEE